MVPWVMTFQPGHRAYPPKDPELLPGRNKASSRRTRHLAVAVTERVEPAVLVEYHVRVGMALPNVRLDEDDDGVLSVVWDEQGIRPTQAEVSAAVKWLADRGHGLAPQSVHLEASVRASLASVSANADIGQLPATVILGILESIRGVLPAPAHSTPATGREVVDVAPELGAGDETDPASET